MLILMMMVAADKKRHQQQSARVCDSASASTPAAASPSNSNATPRALNLGKSSNSSNETVIARIDDTSQAVERQHQELGAQLDAEETTRFKLVNGYQCNGNSESASSSTIAVMSNASSSGIVGPELVSDCGSAAALASDTNPNLNPNLQTDAESSGAKRTSGPSGAATATANRLKSLLLLANHLNPFHHHNHHNHSHQAQASSKSPAAPTKSSADFAAAADAELAAPPTRRHESGKHRSLLSLFSLAQRYFGASRRQSCDFGARLPQQQQQQPHQREAADGCGSKSAPVTPMKWRPLESEGRGANSLLQQQQLQPQMATATMETRPLRPLGGGDSDPMGAAGEESRDANGIVEQSTPTRDSSSVLSATKGGANNAPAVAIANGSFQKPTVRFVESPKFSEESNGIHESVATDASGHSRRSSSSSASRHKLAAVASVKFADCGVQTSGEAVELASEQAEEEEEDDFGAASASLVAKLFPPQLQQAGGEVPMDSKRFQQYGYKLIDYIRSYLDTINDRRVTPLNIEPGYLKSLIQADAPEKGESFANIMQDFENHIMCGITHWQHPHFHAYFPAGNAYPSILADMLSDALGCVGFSWAASPAYTELEIIMLDWMGKMIGLPDEFLCLSGGRGGQESKGGGVIQGSASECVLVNLLAARHWAIERLRKKYPQTPDGMLLSKLIGYCSKEAHSCVEKAAMIGFIRMRALDTDDKHSLRGETLAKAVETDLANGLEPFIVCATLGTTSCVSFDNLEELGKVCKERDVWLHVDAAYAGSALICPEFKYLMRGIEMATSFNMNPNKWMLINFDCSLMWVKDRFKLTRAFVVDPLYLQHSFSDQAIDYRHWGIPLSRRFRALKLWFVIRNYGVDGLRSYIRNHVKLAKFFEQLIRQDSRFTINNEVVLGLVCFRLIGSNALNQRLLSMINASGKLHMVPASLNGRYVIRFCVCDQHAKEEDIQYAYDCIAAFATELFESIRAGKERIRAISQQNTIDVSSISLHTQQSASADRLNQNGESQTGAFAGTPGTPTGGSRAQQQQVGASAGQPQQAPTSPREAARQYLVMRRNSRTGDQSGQPAAASPQSARSPLTKQASMQSAPQAQNHQEGVAAGGEPDEDLEQEIILDSLATMDDNCDIYDLDDDDDLLEPPYFGDEPPTSGDSAVGVAGGRTQTGGQPSAQQMDQMDCRSPIARRLHSRAGRGSRNQTSAGMMGGPNSEQDEAEDEVFTLAERRNRMSLRYKREFFVRVVSDPRVYRASISGDINAHASCCSLGGDKQQQQQPPTQSAQPQSQQQPATSTCRPDDEVAAAGDRSQAST